MAVSETGQWAGYISGGCLEQAIALEAVAAIKAGRHRLLRYGKGSPYFDIRLPCGSGLNVFIQPVEDKRLIEEMRERSERRQAFALRIDLSTGNGKLEELTGEACYGSMPRQDENHPFLLTLPALPRRRLRPDRRQPCGACCSLWLHNRFLCPGPGSLARVAASRKCLSPLASYFLRGGLLDGGSDCLPRSRARAAGFPGIAQELLLLHHVHWQPERSRGTKAGARKCGLFRCRNCAHSKPRGPRSRAEVSAFDRVVDPDANRISRTRTAHHFLISVRYCWPSTK